MGSVSIDGLRYVCRLVLCGDWRVTLGALRCVGWARMAGYCYRITVGGEILIGRLSRRVCHEEAWVCMISFPQGLRYCTEGSQIRVAKAWECVFILSKST